MKLIVLKIFPFLNWLGEVKNSWKQDLVSGLLVAIILIPQSLAYAYMAGMPAHYGLYAALIPVALAALFGSSRQLATGPAILTALLTLTTISTFAEPRTPEFIVLVAILALMVGVIQVGMGLAKLGNLVHFVSQSVIVGFVNAAAILIVMTQVAKIMEITTNSKQHVMIGLLSALGNYDFMNCQSICLGVAALLIIFISRKFFKKIPIVIFVVIGAIIYSKFFGYTGTIIGEIPAGLPSFKFPEIDLMTAESLFTSSIVIAIVSYVSSISIVKTITSITHDHIDPNQELVGQGIANISASISGTTPVSGSFSRSALNLSSGAKTGFASVVTALLILLTLLFLTPLLYHLPVTVLAAVIIASVVKLLDFDHMKKLWSNYKYDGWVAFVSFAATLVLAPRLDYGVIVGIIFSLLMYAHRSQKASLLVFKANDTDFMKKHGIFFDEYESNRKVLAVTSSHSLIFTNADKVNEEILDSVNRRKGIRYILFMFRGVNFIDATAAEMLEQLVGDLRERDITFITVRVKPKLAKFIKNLDLYDQIGSENIFHKANEALKDINKRENSQENGKSLDSKKTSSK